MNGNGRRDKTLDGSEGKLGQDNKRQELETEAALGYGNEVKITNKDELMKRTKNESKVQNKDAETEKNNVNLEETRSFSVQSVLDSGRETSRASGLRPEVKISKIGILFSKNFARCENVHDKFELW